MPRVLPAAALAAVLAACSPPVLPDDDDAGTACTSVDDCPGTSSACRTATCIGGTCGFTMTPDGTALPAQAGGDCLEERCNGMGGIVSVPDDSDLPSDDGNPCTTAACEAGAAVHDPVTAGESCGEGLSCDGAGACVGCVTAESCPGDVSTCRRPSCDEGVCGTALADARTACDDDGLCDGAGACVACLLDDDCPASSIECEANRCVAGACVSSPVEPGTEITDPAGNCARVVCGAAGPETLADDADLPDDGVACTFDLCDGGTPSHPARLEGERCGVAEEGLCDGAGTCVGCLAATDCPGTDSFCAARTCSDESVCGVARPPAGTELPAELQVAGDCATLRCDGLGDVFSGAAPADARDDQNACTRDVCVDGASRHEPADARASCPTGVCDGAGACVACVEPEDCPGTDTECRTRTCADFRCGVEYQPDGTPLFTQIDGNCRELRCDGAGEETNAVDDADLPDDGHDCTDDLCVAGAPSHPPFAAGTACFEAGGHFCTAAGTCVECLAPDDCASGVCHANACAAASCDDDLQNGHETDVDCGGGTCPACTPGSVCADGPDCDSGICSVSSNRCTVSSCGDGVRNGTETRVDCGGSCPACPMLLLLANGAGGAIGASWSPGDASWDVTLLAVKSVSAGSISFRSPTQALALLRFTEQGTADDNHLKYATWSGSWGAFQNVGAGITSLHGPVTATVGSAVSLLFHGTDAHHYFGSWNGLAWSPQAEQVGAQGARTGALAAAGGGTVALYPKGIANELVARTRVGTWQAEQTLTTGINFTVSPALLARPGPADLLAVWVQDGGGQLRFSERTGTTWSAPADVPDATTLDRPVLAPLREGGVALVFRGNDGNLYWTSKPDGGAWTAPEQVTTSVVGAPAAARGLGTAALEVGYVDDTGVAFHVRHEGGAWSIPVSVGGAALEGIAVGATP